MEQQMIPEGYKQTEVGLIPEDWKTTHIGNLVSSLEAGVSVNSDDKIQAFSHGKYILKTSCVVGGYFDSSEVKSILPNDLGRAKTNPAKGSIIVSRMNTPALVGEIGYVPEDYSDLFLPDRLWQVKFNTGINVDSRWLAYLISFPNFSKKIKESATGTSGSMKNISKDAFLSLLIPLPSLKEQNLIAKALSDTDALINELEKLIQKKQAIKTATMQQLLTGKTRLPQFALREDGTKKGMKESEVGEVPEDWEVVPSSSVVNYFGGFNFSSRLSASSGIKWLKIANVGLNEIKWEAESFLPEQVIEDQKDYLLSDGDIVMALTRPLLGDKLKIAIVSSEDSPSMLNQRVAKLISLAGSDLRYIY